MSGYEHVTHKTWQSAEKFTDRILNIRPSYLERVVLFEPKINPVVFSKGQMASKAWMIAAIKSLGLPTHKEVALLGCWVGTQVEFINDVLRPKRMYGFDLEPFYIQMAEEFNAHLVEDNWKFKGVVADVNTLNTSAMQFETGGELIQTAPNIIINTSSEHMSNEWFETASKEQLIIMQTNNSKDEEGHVNTCSSMIDMREKYPLDELLFVGRMIMPSYTRFMQIGTK